jgi:flagellar motor component MotA
MFQTLVLGTYRLIALLVVTLPVLLNLMYQGGVVTSLLHVPTLMLVFSLIAFVVDRKLEKITDHMQQQLAAHKANSNTKTPHQGCMVLKQLWHTPAH